MHTLILLLTLAAPVPQSRPSAAVDHFIPERSPDVWWLPDCAACDANVELAQGHLEWLKGQQRIDVGDPNLVAMWKALELDAERSIRLWRLARGYRIQFGQFPVDDARCLEILREEIGEHDFWWGQMPQPVPGWRYGQ